MPPFPFRAGAASVELTPPYGTQIAGDIGRRRPAETVLEPIFVRALVLESGGARVCLLSAEIAFITTEWVAELRRLAAERFGLDPAGVMVHCVQNHAAPAVGHMIASDECPHIPPELDWLRGGDRAYSPLFVERALQAIGEALGRLEPVRLGRASGVEGRIAFNRRYIMRDGTTRCHPPPGSPDLLHAEGPIDPEVGVLCLTTPDLRVPALLLHFTCHPVHGYPMRYIWGGWPGAWSRGMQEAYGAECVPLVLNGMCGNIHHTNPLDPADVSDHRVMGRLLTEDTHQILRNAVYCDDATLSYATKTIRVPWRRLTEEEVAVARKLIADHPEPVWLDEAHTAVDWDWVYAVSRLDLHELQQREDGYDLEVQAFRLGDTALVAVDGEPFVEGQLRLKLQSPAARTFTAHYANGCVGYIPTPHAIEGGGYETRVGQWSKLCPEALDMMVDAGLELLRGLFPG